jgi:hypothetical protein
MNGEWRYVYVCDECSYITINPFTHICPKCGDKKSIFYNPPMVYGWDEKIAKMVSKTIWYNPFTWGRYEWEFKHIKNT